MAERPACADHATVRREQAYRRGVLLAIGVLLVLSMSPLLGHYLPIDFGTLLAGRAHILSFCVIAVHALFGPVHDAFQILFVGGLIYAALDRLRAWRSLGRALAPFAAHPPVPGSGIWQAVIAAGVAPSRIRVVPGLPTPAFTAGWLRPRIYVAATLETYLTPAELAAVLAHEGAHARRYDPLRLSLLRFLACTLFWIPALRRLAADVAAEGEIRADDEAASRHGLALASALVRLGLWHDVRPSLAVGFTGGDLLERRVLRLTGEQIPPRSSITRRSLAGAGVALLLAWSSGVAVAHPLPDFHNAHCHEHSGALFHLFCSSCLRHEEDSCPHAHEAH